MPENAAVPVSFHLAIERAIDELRRQEAIIISENSHAMLNYPAEFLSEEMLTQLRHPSLQLLITGARARVLGLATNAVRIAVAQLSRQEIMALYDPLAVHVVPSVNAQAASSVDIMALRLVKYAALLPALLIREVDDAHMQPWLHISADDMHHYMESPLIEIVPTAQAALPIEQAEKSSIISFRSRHGTAVHLALVIGDITQTTPLTRIHSSCVTGDILGSLRCDCGDQLKLALNEIAKAGAGILVYLHQEGRGIGITNKLRAYQLQERGFDTYDANLMLGFEEDERDFRIASAILGKLGVARIRMLTNNPQKLAALEQAGIEVEERVALVAESGRHNHAYLEAKAKKSGHLF